MRTVLITAIALCAAAPVTAQDKQADTKKKAKAVDAFTDAYASWIVNAHGNLNVNTKCSNCHAGTVYWNQAENDASERMNINALYAWDTALTGIGLPQAALNLTVPDKSTLVLLGLDSPAVVVEGVCPSEKETLAGLAVHDVILSVNGKPAADVASVHQGLNSTDDLALIVLRKGKQKKLKRAAASKKDGSQRYLIGVTLGELEPVVRTQLGLSDEVTVFIREVQPDSAASDAGLQENDILLKVNGAVVSNNESVQNAVSGSKGKALRLAIVRAGANQTLNVTPRLVDVPTADTRVNLSPSGSFIANAATPWVHEWHPSAATWVAGSQNNVDVSAKLREIEKKLDDIAAVLKSLQNK